MKNCCSDIHESIKEKIKNSSNFNSDVESISKIFSLLGDATRMKIMLSLIEGELCVYHICESVGGKQSAISQHLRKLKDFNLVKCRKEANQVLYSVADKHVVEIIMLALQHKECK